MNRKIRKPDNVYSEGLVSIAEWIDRDVDGENRRLTINKKTKTLKGGWRSGKVFKPQDVKSLQMALQRFLARDPDEIPGKPRTLGIQNQ